MLPIHLREATPIPDLTFPVNVFHLAGEERLIATHWHEHLEWIYVYSGAARVQIDDVFEVVTPGDLVFVNAQQIHSAVSLSDDAVLYALVINQSILHNAGLDSTDRRYFQPIIDGKILIPAVSRREDALTKELCQIFLDIVREFNDQSQGYELCVKAGLFKMFALAVRCSKRADCTARTETDTFGGLFQHLRENFPSRLSLSEAADMVHLSQSQFCRRFKAITGKTLVEYLNLLRIEEAERLLENTDLSLTDIADQVGLTTNAYLTRIFIRYRHITPSQYRQKAQNLPMRSLTRGRWPAGH